MKINLIFLISHNFDKRNRIRLGYYDLINNNFFNSTYWNIQKCNRNNGQNGTQNRYKVLWKISQFQGSGFSLYFVFLFYYIILDTVKDTENFTSTL